MSHRRGVDTNASVDCYIEVLSRHDDRQSLILQRLLAVKVLQYAQDAIPKLLDEIGEQKIPRIGTYAYHSVLDFEVDEARLRLTTNTQVFRPTSSADLQRVISGFEQTIIATFLEVIEDHHRGNSSPSTEKEPSRTSGSLKGWLDSLEFPDDSPGRQLMTPLVELLDVFLDSVPDKGKSSGWPSDI